MRGGIKTKYANVKSETYKDLILNITPKKYGNYPCVSKYKNVFSKDQRWHGCEEAFGLWKVNATVPFIYMIEDLNEQETSVGV